MKVNQDTTYETHRFERSISFEGGVEQHMTAYKTYREPVVQFVPDMITQRWSAGNVPQRVIVSGRQLRQDGKPGKTRVQTVLKVEDAPSWITELLATESDNQRDDD